ncbi:MAG: tetratricopeptide repeat protein [Robiginitalea sp.]
MKRIAFIIVSILLIGCKENTPKTEFLGMVNLEVTGNSKAVSHFERGLLLLHSFEYQDAREAFRKAQEIDPDMPMAYWGEAMTYNHSLWHEQDYDDGVEVLKKLEAMDLEKNATALERDFISAVKILFKPETEKQERDLAYASFMEGLTASNIDSYEASLNRMKRKELDNDGRGYHAYHWLEYGYLQQDNKAEARKMVLDMQRFMNETPSARARTHMVFLKGTYLTETDEWESEIADIPVQISDLNISVRSQYYFLEGMKAYTAKDTAQMDSVIAIIESDIKRETYVQEFSSASLCSNVTRAEAAPSDIVTSKARQRQLMALREDLAERHNKAEEHLLKSIELQESISYSYGPPSIQKPTRELYADWLVSMGRYKEAETKYARAEKAGPKRRLIIEGKENASQFLSKERS